MKLIILASIFFKLCHGFQLDFINAFAINHNRNSLKIYTTNNTKKSILDWKRLWTASNYQGLYRSIVQLEILNDSRIHAHRNEDLCFVEINKNSSIEYVKIAFEKRTRTDHESWLLDISNYESTEDAIADLNNLKIDIDDDIFVCKEISDTEIHFWEIYKISPELDLIVKFYGN